MTARSPQRAQMGPWAPLARASAPHHVAHSRCTRAPCGLEPLRSGPPQASHSAQQQPSRACWSGSACRPPTQQVLVGCCGLLVTVNCALDFRRQFKQEVPPRVSAPHVPAHLEHLSSLVWPAYVCNRHILYVCNRHILYFRVRRQQKPCGCLVARAAALACAHGLHGLGRAACAALPSRLALLGICSARLRLPEQGILGGQPAAQSSVSAACLKQDQGAAAALCRQRLMRRRQPHGQVPKPPGRWACAFLQPRDPGHTESQSSAIVPSRAGRARLLSDRYPPWRC